MKTYNNILYIFLVGIFLFTSCVKEENHDSLYIVSFINPDEPFQVRVQKTASSKEEHGDLNINYAVVQVTNNNTRETIDLISRGDGIYTSNGAKPLAGFDYEVQVKVEGFEDAAATAYVPDLGDVSVNLQVTEVESNAVEFTFSPTMISNKPTNFFAYELVYDKVYNGEEETEETGEETNSETVNSGINTSTEAISKLKPIEGSIADGSSSTVNTTNDLDVDIEEVSVRIVAISSEFYDYLLMNTKERNTTSSSIITHNSQVYSNFVGDAYGIFGGFSEKTIKLVQ